MSGFQEIVPRLYLGNGAVPAAQPRVLQLRGVTHILNVASICECEHRSMFTYMHAKIEDDEMQDLSSVFEPTAQFIQDVLDLERAAIYVHCQAGKSRSATIVLYYLITRRGMSLLDAFNHVKDKRKVIEPNLGFMKQLIDAEVRHRGDASMRFESLALERFYRRTSLTEEIVAQSLAKADGNVPATMWILQCIAFDNREPTQEDVDKYVARLRAWPRDEQLIEVLERCGERESSATTTRRK